MGKDRQERKLRESRRVESDRDQSLQYPGATGLDTPEQARKPALINTKRRFLYCTKPSFIISLMICIYIEITFRILYPPITSLPSPIPIKIKFSPVIRQHTIYIFQPFFNYNFTK